MARKSERLEELRKYVGYRKIKVRDIKIIAIKKFKKSIENVKDVRHRSYIDYGFMDIILVTFLGILNGATTWKDIGKFAKEEEKYLRKIIEFKNGIPSYYAIQRTMDKISPEVLFNMNVEILINGTYKKEENN